MILCSPGLPKPSHLPPCGRLPAAANGALAGTAIAGNPPCAHRPRLLILKVYPPTISFDVPSLQFRLMNAPLSQAPILHGG